MRTLIAISATLLGFANTAIADCPITSGVNNSIARVGFPIGVQFPSMSWNVYQGTNTVQTYRVCYNSTPNTNSVGVCDVEVHNELGKVVMLPAQMGGMSACVDVDGKQIVVKAFPIAPKTCAATSEFVSYCRLSTN